MSERATGCSALSFGSSTQQMSIPQRPPNVNQMKLFPLSFLDDNAVLSTNFHKGIRRGANRRTPSFLMVVRFLLVKH